MHTIKIKSVVFLTVGFFFMIFLHYDVFGISRVDKVENDSREKQVAGITLDKISPAKPILQNAGTRAKHPGIVAVKGLKAISSLKGRSFNINRRLTNQKIK